MKTWMLTALMVMFAWPAMAQKKPSQLTVGMYAPSAAFASSAARLAYIEGLAKAIEARTGIPTTGKAFVRYKDLLGARADFAIVEGVCIASRSPGEVFAQAVIGGATSQPWGLYAQSGGELKDLEGKQLAYVATGCRDKDFVENAMLDGEVKQSYFGKLVSRPDISGAVAAVKDYKAAQAVFAPSAAAKGLTKVFDTGSVPTPAFVVLGKGLPAAVVGDVKASVLGYGAGGGISGWRAATERTYAGLSGQLRSRDKNPVFANPDVVRLEVGEILVIPKSRFEQVAVSQHFWEPK